MNRAHALPSDVITLLERGDKTEAQIFRALKISHTQWLGLRAKLMADNLIATVGRGKVKQYTIVRKSNVEDWK